MKPRTKAEREVAELHEKLGYLTDKQLGWAFDKAIAKFGYNSGRHTWCSECGQSFDTQGAKEVVCPHCGAKLKVVDSKQRKGRDMDNFISTEFLGDWQIVRLWWDDKFYCKGKEATHNLDEVVQYWIRPGKVIVYQKPKCMNAYYGYGNPFVMWRPLELRKRASLNLGGGHLVAVGSTIHPMYRKMGVTTNFHRNDPVMLLENITKYPFIETLLKNRQYKMLGSAVYYPDSFSEVWGSVKVANRHGYKIADYSLWRDYIHSMRSLNEDIRNPKIVCPADLKKAHDEASRRVENKRLREEFKEAMAYNSTFVKQKGRFFELHLSGYGIDVIPLKSVKEFRNEGLMLNHCVFTNGYYKKDDSLILSARKDGKILETVEVSIKNLSILQCHGKSNTNTKYHKQIMEIVKSGMGEISKCNRITA